MAQRGNRRELLADAAIEVLAREGGRGLTHRAIDREAQVPEGTTKNYHPSREALFLAVARRMSDEHAAALRQLREQMPDGVTRDDVTALYTAMVRRMATAARSRFLALFELHLEGVRRPEVREALGEMTVTNADSAMHLHGAVGDEMSRRGGGLLDAGMLGVAMSMLSLPEQVLGEIGFDEPDQITAALLSAARTASGTAESEPAADASLHGFAS